jgi:nucleotide-binding universal stress UspA family protein
MNEALQRPSPFRRILFCTDFSENADYAFEHAIDATVRRPGATLYLLHVIPEPEAQFWKTYIYEVEGVDAKARADIDAKIALTYVPRVPPGIQFEIHMRIGKDYGEIIKFAEAHDVDLIILGRHGHSALEHALFGNVAEKVVRKARCAVLLVPLMRPRVPPAAGA